MSMPTESSSDDASPLVRGPRVRRRSKNEKDRPQIAHGQLGLTAASGPAMAMPAESSDNDSTLAQRPPVRRRLRTDRPRTAHGQSDGSQIAHGQSEYLDRNVPMAMPAESSDDDSRVQRPPPRRRVRTDGAQVVDVQANGSQVAHGQSGLVARTCPMTVTMPAESSDDDSHLAQRPLGRRGVQTGEHRLPTGRRTGRRLLTGSWAVLPGVGRWLRGRRLLTGSRVLWPGPG